MDKGKFYKHVRDKLGPLTQSQVNGFEALLKAVDTAPLAHKSYMLATAWHETDKTMQPVREAFRLSEAWRKKNLRYYPHYGRGYVQITWDRNYRLADAELAKAGIIRKGDLIKNLDLAMRPDVAAFILRKGMEDGWFGKRKLQHYLPVDGSTATRDQYMAARQTVNIMDKADLIEDYAQVFEKAYRNADA